jgi:DNA replication protein DnaC
MNEMKSLGDALHDLNPRLRAEMERLAAEGFSPETPAPDCTVCEDRGVISYAVPFGHELFGKLYPCPNCRKGHDLLVNQWRARLQNAGLPASYQGLTFESWQALPESLKEGKRLAFNAAMLFVASTGHYVSLSEAYRMSKRRLAGADVVRNSLVFQGPVGTGKTGLAAAIINAMLEQLQPVLYVRTQDFIMSVQARYGNGDEKPTSDDVISELRQAPVVVLDEFNLEMKSDNRQEIMEKVIRYRHGQALPTIVTCNFTQTEMRAQWGERTVSVLLAMAHWIPMGGEAIRDERPPLEVF